MSARVHADCPHAGQNSQRDRLCKWTIQTCRCKRPNVMCVCPFRSTGAPKPAGHTAQFFNIHSGDVERWCQKRLHFCKHIGFTIYCMLMVFSVFLTACHSTMYIPKNNITNENVNVGLDFGLNLVIVAHRNIATALLFSFFGYTKDLPCTLAVLPWLPTTE